MGFKKMKKHILLLLKILFIYLPAIYGYYVFIYLVFLEQPQIVYQDIQKTDDTISVIEVVE